MDRSLKTSRSIEINANAAKVWDALTNPEKIKAYLFSSEIITDWKPGNPIIFKGEYEGEAYTDKGNVLENNEGVMLKYNYWNSFTELDDIPENYTIVTYTLTPIDADNTTFTWTQEGFYDADWQEQFEEILEDETLVKVKGVAEAT